jgi:hypothetical protein
MARGFGFSPILVGLPGRDVWFCSPKCFGIWKGNGMTDWVPIENEMLLECGKAGGEYLESVGVSDLAQLNADQWLQFLQSIVGRLHEVRPEYDRRLEDSYQSEDPFGLPKIE